MAGNDSSVFSTGGDSLDSLLNLTWSDGWRDIDQFDWDTPKSRDECPIEDVTGNERATNISVLIVKTPNTPEITSNDTDALISQTEELIPGQPEEHNKDSASTSVLSVPPISLKIPPNTIGRYEVDTPPTYTSHTFPHDEEAKSGEVHERHELDNIGPPSSNTPLHIDVPSSQLSFSIANCLHTPPVDPRHGASSAELNSANPQNQEHNGETPLDIADTPNFGMQDYTFETSADKDADPVGQRTASLAAGIAPTEEQRPSFGNAPVMMHGEEENLVDTDIVDLDLVGQPRVVPASHTITGSELLGFPLLNQAGSDPVDSGDNVEERLVSPELLLQPNQSRDAVAEAAMANNDLQYGASPHPVYDLSSSSQQFSSPEFGRHKAQAGIDAFEDARSPSKLEIAVEMAQSSQDIPSDILAGRSIAGSIDLAETESAVEVLLAFNRGRDAQKASLQQSSVRSTPSSRDREREGAGALSEDTPTVSAEVPSVLPVPSAPRSTSPKAPALSPTAGRKATPKSNSQLKRTRSSKPKNPSSSVRNDKTFKPDATESEDDAPAKKKGKKAASKRGGEKKTAPRRRTSMDGAEDNDVQDEIEQEQDPITVFEDGDGEGVQSSDEEIEEIEEFEQSEQIDQTERVEGFAQAEQARQDGQIDRLEEVNEDTEVEQLQLESEADNEEEELTDIETSERDIDEDNSNTDDVDSDEDEEDKENTPPKPVSRARKSLKESSPQEYASSSSNLSSIEGMGNTPHSSHNLPHPNLTYTVTPPHATQPTIPEPTSALSSSSSTRSLTAKDLVVTYGKRTTRSETKAATTTPKAKPQPKKTRTSKPTANTKGKAAPPPSKTQPKSTIPTKRRASTTPASSSTSTRRKSTPALGVAPGVPSRPTRHRTRAAEAAEKERDANISLRLRARQPNAATSGSTTAAVRKGKKRKTM